MGRYGEIRGDGALADRAAVTGWTYAEQKGRAGVRLLRDGHVCAREGGARRDLPRVVPEEMQEAWAGARGRKSAKATEGGSS